MSVADYVNRTVDMLVFQGFSTARDHLLSQSLVDVNGFGTIGTGIVKLAQRFLLLLLTEAGSIQFQPTTGCNFMKDARKGRWRTTGDVNQSFGSAVLDIRRQIRLMQLATDPLDEQYDSATLINVQLNGDQVVLRILLTSMAGTPVTLIAPLTVSVR